MPIGALQEIVVDCTNPEALARFWQALIGGEVDVESDDLAVLDDDALGFYLCFQRADGGGSRAPSRTRFHVEVDDLATAVDQAEQMGARKIGGHVDTDDGVLQVMADPGGNEFCFTAE